MLRRPNSLRVGNVSETSVSPVNQDEYMIIHPYAWAKFCCADRDRIGASATGSSALASITVGSGTVSQSLHPARSRAPATTAELASLLRFRMGQGS